jgi:hypothetical protein
MMLRQLARHVASAAGAIESVPVREELRSQPLEMPAPPDSVADMAAQFLADGFLHLPGCLTLGEAAHLRERSDALWREWGDGKFDGSTKALHAVCGSSYDPAFLLPLDKEPTCSVAGAALGPGFKLFGDSVWSNRLRPQQNLHVDYQQCASARARRSCHPLTSSCPLCRGGAGGRSGDAARARSTPRAHCSLLP